MRELKEVIKEFSIIGIVVWGFFGIATIFWIILTVRFGMVLLVGLIILYYLFKNILKVIQRSSKR